MVMWDQDFALKFDPDLSYEDRERNIFWNVMFRMFRKFILRKIKYSTVAYAQIISIVFFKIKPIFARDFILKGASALNLSWLLLMWAAYFQVFAQIPTFWLSFTKLVFRGKKAKFADIKFLIL